MVINWRKDRIELLRYQQNNFKLIKNLNLRSEIGEQEEIIQKTH